MGQVHHLLPGHHGHDSARCLCPRHVDAADGCVRVRAPEKRGVKDARGFHVGDEPALPAKQSVVFDSLHALADEPEPDRCVVSVMMLLRACS